MHLHPQTVAHCISSHLNIHALNDEQLTEYKMGEGGREERREREKRDFIQEKKVNKGNIYKSVLSTF